MIDRNYLISVVINSKGWWLSHRHLTRFNDDVDTKHVRGSIISRALWLDWAWRRRRLSSSIYGHGQCDFLSVPSECWFDDWHAFLSFVYTPAEWWSNVRILHPGLIHQSPSSRRTVGVTKEDSHGDRRNLNFSAAPFPESDLPNGTRPIHSVKQWEAPRVCEKTRVNSFDRFLVLDEKTRHTRRAES